MSEQSIYKIEPGMRVHSPGDVTGIVDSRDPDKVRALRVSRDCGGYIWRRAETLTPDWDHPGTRGLLLQQYRDRSGHADAQPARGEDGRWRMCPRPFRGDEPTGEGATEGECILDALTRLTGAQDDTEPTVDAPPHQAAPASAPLVVHFPWVQPWGGDSTRTHQCRAVIDTAAGTVKIERLTGQDALGVDRWDPICDDGDTPWLDMVAVAVAKHAEAVRSPRPGPDDHEATLHATRDVLVEHGVIGPAAPLGCVSLAVKRVLTVLPGHADGIADLRDRVARIESVLGQMAHGSLDLITGDDLDALGAWLGVPRMAAHTATGSATETDADYRHRMRFRHYGQLPPSLDIKKATVDIRDRLTQIEQRLRLVESRGGLS